MELKRRIAFLWALIMGGFAIHSLADLMPLFWSEDISIVFIEEFDNGETGETYRFPVELD